MPTAAERAARPSRALRIVLVAGVGLLLLTAVGIGAVGAAIHRGGTIHLDVRSDDGTDIAVSVPAGLAGAAVALIPRSALRSLAEEIGPLPAELLRVWPAVRGSCDELERAGDFVLLEVHDGGDSTVVRKRDGVLLVDYRDDDGEWHVAVPLGAVRAVISKLEQVLI